MEDEQPSQQAKFDVASLEVTRSFPDAPDEEDKVIDQDMLLSPRV